MARYGSLGVDTNETMMTLYIVQVKPKNDISGLRRVRIRQYIEIATIWRNTPSRATNARFDTNNSYATWREEEYSPQLAMDGESVLDRYFDDIIVERVSSREQGWKILDDKAFTLESVIQHNS